MSTHRFVPTAFHNVLGTLPPALTVASGDTVITETIDAGGTDKHGVKVGNRPNPMNGPIFVTGAEPGDALKVEILRMTPVSPTGWTRTSLAANVVDPHSVRALPPSEVATWLIDRQGLTTRLENPPAGLEEDLPAGFSFERGDFSAQACQLRSIRLIGLDHCGQLSALGGQLGIKVADQGHCLLRRRRDINARKAEPLIFGQPISCGLVF